MVQSPPKRWPYPAYVAHRGGGVLAPENTLAGFREGLRYGFRAAECDVKLSADGVCFLLHDDSVDRTSSGRGLAASMSMAQLSQLDAGSWRGAAFAGEAFPTLATIAACCRTHGIALNIEIKPCPGRERETGVAVAREALRLWQGAAVPPLLSSFDYDALDAAMQAAPTLPRAMLFEEVPEDWLACLVALDAVGLHTDHSRLDEATARAIKAAGYPLMCYTVNEVDVAQRLLSWGVDALCTDRLDRFLPA